MANFVEMLLKILGITIFKKLHIAAMHVDDPSGMLDRAPILLGPPGDLLDKRDHAIKIAAISAVYFLYNVQVIDATTVHYNVISAADLGNPVNREADELVER